MRKYLRILLFLFPPAMILIGLSPIILSSPPYSEDKLTEKLNIGFLITLYIYHLGFLAFVIYSYIVITGKRKMDFKSLYSLILIRLSLTVGILASIFGIFIGYMLPFLSIFSLISLVLCAIIFWGFETVRG